MMTAGDTCKPFLEVFFFFVYFTCNVVGRVHLLLSLMPQEDCFVCLDGVTDTKKNTCWRRPVRCFLVWFHDVKIPSITRRESMALFRWRRSVEVSLSEMIQREQSCAIDGSRRSRAASVIDRCRLFFFLVCQVVSLLRGCVPEHDRLPTRVLLADVCLRWFGSGGVDRAFYVEGYGGAVDVPPDDHGCGEDDCGGADIGTAPRRWPAFGHGGTVL